MMNGLGIGRTVLYGIAVGIGGLVVQLVLEVLPSVLRVSGQFEVLLAPIKVLFVGAICGLGLRWLHAPRLSSIIVAVVFILKEAAVSGQIIALMHGCPFEGQRLRITLVALASLRDSCLFVVAMAVFRSCRVMMSCDKWRSREFKGVLVGGMAVVFGLGMSYLGSIIFCEDAVAIAICVLPVMRICLGGVCGIVIARIGGCGVSLFCAGGVYAVASLVLAWFGMDAATVVMVPYSDPITIGVGVANASLYMVGLWGGWRVGQHSALVDIR